MEERYKDLEVSTKYTVDFRIPSDLGRSKCRKRRFVLLTKIVVM